MDDNNKGEYCECNTLNKMGCQSYAAFCRAFLIGWIVWFAFHTDGLAKETQNLLSAIVGGLIVNYTKMSGYIFSRESDDNDR